MFPTREWKVDSRPLLKCSPVSWPPVPHKIRNDGLVQPQAEICFLRLKFGRTRVFSHKPLPKVLGVYNGGYCQVFKSPKRTIKALNPFISFLQSLSAHADEYQPESPPLHGHLQNTGHANAIHHPRWSCCIPVEPSFPSLFRLSTFEENTAWLI